MSIDQSKRVLAERGRLKRAVASHFDMLEAQRSLERLEEIDTFDEPPMHRDHDFLAHSTCLVIAYARPFGKNAAGNSTAPRLPSGVLSGYSDAEKACHDRVLELRNREFAHSDGHVADVVVEIRRGAAFPLSRVMRHGLTKADVQLLGSMIAKVQSEIMDILTSVAKELPEGDRF